MIAVSSHKPFIEDPDYAIHQKRAFNSWLPHFDKIVYLGNNEPDLYSERTVFAPSEKFPTIKIMAEIASVLNGDACVINSDIVLTSDFSKVKNIFRKSKYSAGTSKRLEFSHGNLNGSLKDHGLDIFIARPEVWKIVSRLVPKQLRIGHNLWDSWLIGFLNVKFKDKVCDFSHFKCVLHPQHNGRVRPYEVSVKDEYIQKAGMPGSKLR